MAITDWNDSVCNEMEDMVKEEYLHLNCIWRIKEAFKLMMVSYLKH